MVRGLWIREYLLEEEIRLMIHIMKRGLVRYQRIKLLEGYKIKMKYRQVKTAVL